MPDGLRHVISGILAGGIPSFRMVLLLLRSPPGMALWLCFFVSFVSAAIPCQDDTMLSLLHSLISPWTGTCHTSVWLFCFGLLCFVLVVCVFCFVLVLLLFLVFDDFVTDWTMYRSFTRSLLKPLNLQAAMYALISQLPQFATCNWTCWTTWRKPWRRWTGKKRQTKNTHHKSKLARIDRHFPWQAWHLQHWTGFGVGPLVVAGEFFTHHLYHLSQTIVPCNCFNFSILHHPVLSIFLGQNGPIHPYHIGIPQASQPVPQQLAETEKRYMELQAVMATLGQRTLAESRLKANQPDQKPDGTTDSPAPKQADTGLDTQDSSQPPPTKLSAQTLTAARPTPPPPTALQRTRKDAPGRAIWPWPQTPRRKETAAARQGTATHCRSQCWTATNTFANRFARYANIRNSRCQQSCPWPRRKFRCNGYGYFAESPTGCPGNCTGSDRTTI